MEVRMTITTHYSGIKRTKNFIKEVDSLDDLKTAFLKRFGNMNDETNKLMSQKKYVKELTYKAKTLNDWVQEVNTKTSWNIDILFLQGSGF